MNRALFCTKIGSREWLSEFVDKLDAHYGFDLLRFCFSMPKLLYVIWAINWILERDFLHQLTKFWKGRRINQQMCASRRLRSLKPFSPCLQSSLRVSSLLFTLFRFSSRRSWNSGSALWCQFCGQRQTQTPEAPDSERHKSWSSVLYRKVLILLYQNWARKTWSH